jgi:hypothetical protein
LDPYDTREAAGGIGQTASGDFKAFAADIDPSASPIQTKQPNGAEISERTGGVPIAGFHTHQLTGRAFPSGHPLASNAHPHPKGKDLRVAEIRPLFVISNNQIRMAWKTDKGKVKTALVATYKNPAALKRGDFKIITPKRLRVH